MATSSEKSILFLCTGNYYRSRFAEILFNSLAGKMDLCWKATSSGLSVDRGSKNVGPMSKLAIKRLETMGIRAFIDVARFPAQTTADHLSRADLIVALKQAEHLPILEERFPGWAEKIEFWQVDDVPEALAAIEREMETLIARLIGGGKSDDRPTAEIVAEAVDSEKKKELRKNAVVRVGRETKGRRGKGVTIVSDVPLDEAALLELATKLKQRCGTGGTVKDGRIEIQGDQRDRLILELEGMGYRVKRVEG